MNKFSKAFIGLSILFAVVVIAAGVGGYLLWQRNQQLSDTNAQQSSYVNSLRDQLAAARATPAPTPAPTPTPTPIAAVALTQYAVHYTPTADIADVTPTYSASTKNFTFSSPSLSAKGAQCGAGALGTLSRQAKGSAASASLKPNKVATVGAYDYYYLGLETGCDQTGDGNTLQTAQTTSLKAALAGLH